ncbi:MAG: LysM peptidoglycan-binding domain-containing protein [Bdellovibrio bacteriovorus]
MLIDPPRIGLVLLLVALGLGGAVPGAQGESADLGLEVEELTQRIQGMEGKLRESAAARKAADQARMEAERRLAEGAQELDRLRAEVGLLRDANLALEERLRRAKEEAEIAAQSLLTAEESARRLGAERDAEAAGKATLERQVDQLIELQRQTDVPGQARLRVLTQGQSDLGGALAESQSDLKRVQLELRAAQAERDALRRRLDALRPASPVLAGEVVTLEEAQTQAGGAALALHEALAGVPSSGDAGVRRAVRAAAQELYRRQLQVARLLGARSVYRVGPGDSFERIAGRFYGDGRRWPEILEANRQVAPDPGHLVPGITLVIP